MTDTGTFTAATKQRRRSSILSAILLASITLMGGCSAIEGWLYGPNEPVMPTAGMAPYPPVYEDSYAAIPSPDQAVAPVDRARGTEVFPAMLDSGGSVASASSYPRLDASLQAQRQNVAANGQESYAPIDYSTTNRPFASGVSASAPAGQPALSLFPNVVGSNQAALPQQRIAELPPRNSPPAARPSPVLGIAPVTGTGNMIGVQVGAYRIQENADRGWYRVLEMYSGMLDTLVPVVVEVDLGSKGTFFRLIATGVDSVASARDLCDDLIVRGQDWCAVRRM